MLDLVMLVMVIAVFAAAMAYVDACRRIKRQPNLSREEPE